MGEVRKLWIEGEAGKLEAALRVADGARAAAVVAHPHPLHGGTLNNPVVFHVDRELNRAGLTTLRFNFRGTGTSEGSHDDGRGEVADVTRAACWLRGVTNGVPLLLVGYSFGSICSLRHAVADPAVAALVAIGLPARHYEFDELARFDRPLAVVHGADDELASPDDVRELLHRHRRSADVRLVPGATHLFPGRATEAADQVLAAVEQILGTF
jgi:alpha/beta superfamily hydrolase